MFKADRQRINHFKIITSYKRKTKTVVNSNTVISNDAIFKMPFSYEDKCAIKLLRQNKGYSARKLLKEFPTKEWTLGGLNKLLKKIDVTGSVDRKFGSGRPRTVRTDERINQVEKLVLSQENAPQTHL